VGIQSGNTNALKATMGFLTNREDMNPELALRSAKLAFHVTRLLVEFSTSNIEVTMTNLL